MGNSCLRRCNTLFWVLVIEPEICTFEVFTLVLNQSFLFEVFEPDGLHGFCWSAGLNARIVALGSSGVRSGMPERMRLSLILRVCMSRMVDFIDFNSAVLMESCVVIDC